MRQPALDAALVSLLACALWLGNAGEISARKVESDVPQRVDDLQSLEVKAEPINDFIYKIEGEGAMFLINTREGSVLVDTGVASEQSADQKQAVRELATGPIRKIVVTHAHADHAGGLPAWQEEIDAGAEFIGHHRYAYMARLQDEPLPYFKRRFHVLYPTRVSLEDEPPRPYWNMRPAREVYPGSDYEFELGGVRFVVIAPENGGEGEDGILLWLPESRVLFTGDLFGTLYPMFPNLYTVRGEKYRDPLDYVDALDLVLELKPEVIAHTHFRVIEGEEYIRESVTRMRDAVQYVWDETVKGMNAGKTVWELMRDIQLPEHLQLSQGHGKVSWSVRATWEIIAGWYYYDTIANLYHVPPTAIHRDVVEMVGGADALAARARTYLAKGQPLEAIRLLDIAAGNETKAVLNARIEAVEKLIAEAKSGLSNYSEIGLLEADLRASRQLLAGR
ncbi:MAG: MBL fold metallo-hydrolase [Deltaproteobacteria bacterium]|nr:MBL fold metallo-hydrolase [Deltaproteobacteria bacterium]MBW2359977.1 MBL fold metallo-hydrolase [Deltaproteobacteria bacterium]